MTSTATDGQPTGLEPGPAPVGRAPGWSSQRGPAPARPKAGTVLLEGLGAARAAVGGAARVAGSSLSNADLTAAATELAALTSQVQALSLAVMAEARTRGQAGPAGDEGDADVPDWLGRLTGDPAEVIRGGMLTARLLQQKYHHVRGALEDGRLRLSQAKVIVRAAERAPRRLTPEQVTGAEEALVLTATGEGTRSGRAMPAKALRAEARRVFADLLGSKAEADAAEGGDVESDEDRAERECYLSVSDRGDGTWRGSFVLPDLHARLLIGALEHLTSPRRRGKDGQGEEVVDDSAEVIGLSWGERMGSAFCELLEHLPTDKLAKSAIGLLVRVPYETLATGAGVGYLDDATPTSARTVRRLACTCGHVPVVLSGASVPLDVGRLRRLFGTGVEHALAALHDTCAIAGCTRPFSWCELHHLRAWSEGGPTDFSNALPLCGYHHRRAHDPTYDLTHHHGREYRLRRRR